MADTITWLDEPATINQAGVTWLDEPTKPKLKKTRAQVTAEVEKAQAARPTEELSTLEKVANAAYWPAYVASKMDPVSAILSAASPNNPDLLNVPTISPETVKEALKYSMLAPTRPDSAMAGVQNFTANLVSGMTTPHSVAGLLSGGINRALPAVTFTPPMVASIPETTEQLLQSETPAQVTESGLNLASSMLFPLLMARHAQQPRSPGGAQPSDFGPYIIEPDVLPPAPPRYIPAQRQLTAPEPITIDVAPPTQLPLTTATTLAERNNPQPFSQIIRSQEPIDPATMKLGREREPIITPQPEDLRSIVKQSIEEVMGRLLSNEKRPSQESPVLLGGQQTQAPMVYGPRPVPLDVKVEEGRAFTPKAEVEGGKVSFAAPAEQGVIPSARQSSSGMKTKLKPGQGKQAGSIINPAEYFLKLYSKVAKQAEKRISEIKEKLSSYRSLLTRENLPSVLRIQIQDEIKRMEADIVLTETEVATEIKKKQNYLADGPSKFYISASRGGVGFRDTVSAQTKQEAEEKFRQAYELEPDDKIKLVQSETEYKERSAFQAAQQREADLLQYEEDLRVWRKKKSKAEQKGDEFDEPKPDHPDALAIDQESRLAPKQDQPAPIEKPVPFVYKGLQPGVPEAGIPDFHLYNMTETVGKLAKGSTVSEKSLKEAGFEIPEGMPKSGIGGGIKKAVEKNKEAGSIANPFEALREKFKKKEEELRGDFALDAPRYLLDPKVSGFNNPTREVDSVQLWNRLKNKLNPAELDVYEKSGVGEKIRKMGKVSPETRSTKLYGGAFFFDPDFWRDTFKTKEGEKPERVVGGLQKLDSYEKEFARANRIQGAGKLGKTIGGFLDPRRKAVGNEVAQALVAWHSQVDTGRKMATLWAESRKRLGDIVADSKDGKIALANGQRGFMSDVFEREIASPGSQPLTPQQKQAVEFAKRVFKETGMELNKENVKGFLESDKDKIDLSQPYFARPAIGKVGKEMTAGPTKRAIGSERFFQRGRKFPTEKMGFESGIRYEPSFYGRMSRYLQDYYRAIADERLATHLEKLSESEHKFMENALTYHPAFRGRYFSDAGHQAISRSLDRPGHQIEKISRAVQDYKKLRFTFDVSYLGNQMLPSLLMNPSGFATAALQGFKALVSDKALSEYIAKPENLAAAQALTRNGQGVGNLWEFIGGGDREGWIDKVTPIKASGRAMQVALDVAKVELYKALKPVMKKQGWSEADLVEAIGNAVYSAPGSGIGVSDTRAIVEKLAFNAPNYLRATANMLASLATEGGKNTPAGYVARRAIVGLSAAILIQMGVAYMAMVKLGLMDEDEMKDRLNPTNAQFMKLPVKVPMGKEGGLEGSADDKVVEMSYGNILLSMARAVGALGAIAKGDKDGSLLGPDNPTIRFVSARLSPWWSVVNKVLTGENYQGQKRPAWELIGEELLPIVLNPSFEEKGSRAGIVASLGSGVGMNTSIESRGARQKRLEKEYAQLTYKAPVSKLNVQQRRNTTAKAEQALAGEEKDGPSLYSLEAPKKRAEKVTGLLSSESRTMLEQAGLKVPNIIATQTEDKKPLRLNKEEQDFYLETYAKELDRRLTNIRKSGNEVNKKRFESITQSVGEFSWTQTKRLINTRAKGESVSQR